MAKIIDLDDLSYVVDTTAGGTDEVEFQTGAKTIQLLPQGVLSDASPGATSGVTGKCIYSLCKEAWKDNSTLNKHKFPIQMIYEASFVWINGWGPADQQTRDLFRDAGFQETDGRENACIISLGAMHNSADQAYYTNAAGFDQTKANFDKTGEINENVQIIGTGGTPDNSGYFKAFLREEQKIFASYDLLNEQGLSALTYQAYRLPLSNYNGGNLDANAIDDDTQIGTSDAGSISGVKYSELTIDYLVGNGFTSVADTTYSADDVIQEDNGSGSHWFRCTAGGTVTGSTGVAQSSWGGTATWEAYPGERQIGTEWYAFNRILDVQDTTNSFKARNQETHSWAQYQCRQASDINDNVNADGYGTVYGNVARPFTSFVGSTLVTAGGVYIDNFDTNDQNSIEFYDITKDGGGLDSEDAPVTTTKRTYPFVAAGNLNFSANIVGELDAETRYTMYFAYHTIAGPDTSIGVGTPTGASADITWTGTVLDHLATSDYFIAEGFTNTENNGLWYVNSTGSNTLNATKQDQNPVSESASASVTIKENPFESDNATIVDNNSATDIDGQVSASSIGWDYDYDYNVQRGAGTNGSDAPVILVALAYDGAQYITVPHTITRATGQTINVSPADELNYDNPA